MSADVQVIGGGLAGTECAYQLAERGLDVTLYEMRPRASTPAHKTGSLAELVCSNSLRSDDPLHAAGLLKREMESFGSLIIAAARRSAVPAGSALAVDRELFADTVTSTIEQHPRIDLQRRELLEIPDGPVVIATGPLTSPAMSRSLEELLGSESLYFYDAISPIVEAEGLDYDTLFWASRWGKGDGDDYLNAPLTREQYLSFHENLVGAEVVELHSFEKTLFFEGCLPIEEMARRGVDTLRFGPMKPVGLQTPSGERAYAVVQLRREDLARSQFSLVGFQSRLTWPEQRRILRRIPGLEKAVFTRLGQVHRNTFIDSPLHLDRLYRLRKEPRIRLAGQITGVEGYLESAASGLLVGIYISLGVQDREPPPLPFTTALGAMSRHLVESSSKRFQPANINYGLFPPLDGRVKKRERRAAYAQRASADLSEWSKLEPQSHAESSRA